MSGPDWAWRGAGFDPHAMAAGPSEGWGFSSFDSVGSSPGSMQVPPPFNLNAGLVGSMQAAAEAERKQRVRFMDLQRKKNTRNKTKALLRRLWDLETEARKGEKGVVYRARAKAITLHAVLVETTARINKMAREAPKKEPAEEEGKDASPGPDAEADKPDEVEGAAAGAEAEAGEAVPTEAGGVPVSCEAAQARANPPGALLQLDLVAGLEGSHSIGVLYVCLDDWVVRRTNKAVELVCPFEMIRGYVGFELTAVVHPEDHLQLELLRDEQVHTFKPGDPLVLSVRMLRACQDKGTLVCGWRRLALEVASVAKDKEHGGKLHVLFSCVLEPDALEPLTFDEADRALFREASTAASGAMVVDATRTTHHIDVLGQAMSDLGLKERPKAPSPGSGGRAEDAVGSLTDGVLKFLRSCAASTFNNIVRGHVILGLAPDGTPWVQKASKVCAFGLASRWRIYNCMSMSGRPTTSRSTGARMAYGAIKPRREEDGGVVIGFISMAIECTDHQAGGQRRRINMVIENNFLTDLTLRTSRERSWFLLLKEAGAMPTKVDMNLTRTAPPDPELARQFWSFSGPERVVDPFSHLMSRDSD